MFRMLFSAFRAECLKLRRSYIWLAVAILPLFSAFFGTFNYQNNVAILQNHWYDLWSQHTLFYGWLFAPSLVGVYCAYLCRLEHRDHNWNQVLTAPVSPLTIILSKLVAIARLSAVTQLIIGVFFVLSGKLIGLTQPIPRMLPLWLLGGWVALIVQSAVLLLVALTIPIFAIPVGVGIVGGFVGLAAASKGLGVYIPFSLLSLAMCSNRPQEPMQCPVWLFAISCCFYLLLGIGSSVLWLKHRDVTTA